MADVALAEISVRLLPTKAVTLAPARATVEREIHATIWPGPNQLTIFDLDPTIHPDSIRVETTSPGATITDIQTENVSRRETFDDLYPVDSDSDSEGDEDDGSSSNDDDDPALTTLTETIARVEARLARARDDQMLSQSNLGFLDRYGAQLHPEHVSATDLAALLEVYARQRAADAATHHAAAAAERQFDRELAALYKQRDRLERARHKARAAQAKAAHRRTQRRDRERAQRKALAQRRRQDQRKFFTHSMTQVVVYVDATTVAEPAEPDSVPVSNEILLVLRYTLPHASWSPRYELSLLTAQPASARLVYRGEFLNSSSETWRDACVTLSTSEAAWASLAETVPVLRPWHIRLEPMQKDDEKSTGTASGSHRVPSWKKILKDAPESRAAMPKSYQQQLVGLEQKNRVLLAQDQPKETASNVVARQQPATGHSLFGRPPQQNTASGGFGSGFGARQQQQQQPMFGHTSASSVGAPAAQQEPPSASGGLFGAARRSSGGLFGNTGAQPSGGLFGGLASRPQQQLQQQRAMLPPPEAPSGEPQPSPAMAQLLPPALAQAPSDSDSDSEPETSSISSSPRNPKSGLTTTYALPGTRTLVPSMTCRRHILATLDLSDVTLRHTVVPRHRAAAFFGARILNRSTLKILRGRVGVSVDGAFLGTGSLAPCAPHAAFDVSLGVDPAVLVSYAKPSVRPVSAGFFAKEQAAVFRRVCWVKNTKEEPVDITVLEHLPVSQDEKLRVGIVEPAGLENREGARVKIAMAVEKGSAEVEVLKDGQVKWSVRLRPGKEFRAVLEYEARAPVGSEVGGESL